MVKKISKYKMGKSNLGWLKSRFHFSFAEYFNPNNMNFGVLRVLNDDIILPESGFNTHPHANMEIISYVINGEITHKDSMGNSETLRRGEVQYISAGDGIYHSEHNMHESKELRLLQIWIIPPKLGLPRLYGSQRYKNEERKNKLLNIVSSQDGYAKVKIYQNINIYVGEYDKNKEILYKIEKNRQIYYVQIEGKAKVNNLELDYGDAVEITKENQLYIETVTNSHFLFIEMQEDF